MVSTSMTVPYWARGVSPASATRARSAAAMKHRLTSPLASARRGADDQRIPGRDMVGAVTPKRQAANDQQTRRGPGPPRPPCVPVVRGKRQLARSNGSGTGAHGLQCRLGGGILDHRRQKAEMFASDRTCAHGGDGDPGLHRGGAGQQFAPHSYQRPRSGSFPVCRASKRRRDRCLAARPRTAAALPERALDIFHHPGALHQQIVDFVVEIVQARAQCREVGSPTILRRRCLGRHLSPLSGVVSGMETGSCEPPRLAQAAPVSKPAGAVVRQSSEGPCARTGRAKKR